MRGEGVELTDQDLERLASLGGGADQIAEAAGIDVAQVRQRLARAPHLASRHQAVVLEDRWDLARHPNDADVHRATVEIEVGRATTPG